MSEVFSLGLFKNNKVSISDSINFRQHLLVSTPLEGKTEPRHFPLPFSQPPSLSHVSRCLAGEACPAHLLLSPAPRPA